MFELHLHKKKKIVFEFDDKSNYHGKTFYLKIILYLKKRVKLNLLKSFEQILIMKNSEFKLVFFLINVYERSFFKIHGIFSFLPTFNVSFSNPKPS